MATVIEKIWHSRYSVTNNGAQVGYVDKTIDVASVDQIAPRFTFKTMKGAKLSMGTTALDAVRVIYPTATLKGTE